MAKKCEMYEVSGETLVRKSKFCPRCGDGVFMAEHKNRFSCGSCGYTEWKEKEGKQEAKQAPKPEPKEEKPKKEPKPKAQEPKEEKPKEEPSEKKKQ